MLHYQMNVQSIDDFSWIIEAAHETMNATEKDFDAIRSKKWYKRLWETVTFSKDNQIKLAKGVSSLSKLQEIMIRLLVVLSQNNTEISDAVKQNSDLINKLCVTDLLLSKQIDRIRFGGTSQIEFSDLDREKKAIIASLLLLADPAKNRTDYSKQYISSILTAANITSIDNTVRPEAVDSLRREEQELLYRMIMIGRYLMDADFDDPSEVIDCIPISMKRAKEIRASILETACAVSPEFFVTYYEKSCNNFDEISDDEIIFHSECSSENNVQDENERSSETCTADSDSKDAGAYAETLQDNQAKLELTFKKTKAVLMSDRLLQMQQEDNTSFYKSATECSDGELKAILAQMTYPGQESISDILGIFDINPFHAINNKYSGILFLLNGFYFKENDKAPLQYMNYSDIVRVEEKYFNLLIIGKHETLKLKSASYAQTPLAEVFRSFGSMDKYHAPSDD